MKGAKDSFGKIWCVNPSGNICFVNLPDDPDCTSICAELKKIAPTAYSADTYQGPLICVKEQDANKIPALIQSILDQGHKVWMNDGSQLTLLPGQKYTTENVEHLLLQMYTKYKEMMPVHDRLSWTDFAGKVIKRHYILASSFESPILKEFLLTEFPEENRKDEEHKRNQKKPKIENNSEQPKIEKPDSVVERKPDSEESGMCVICEDQEAATYLIPCDHIFCCEKCSLELEKNLTYRDKCIVCQKQITQINYLKSGKVIYPK